MEFCTDIRTQRMPRNSLTWDKVRKEIGHRSGKSSFGRRFKKQFSGVALPQPIREIVEVQDQLELNELETIWMFQHHTWRGYEGGMNLTFPGSLDYKVLGRIGSREAKAAGGRIGGHIQGRKNAASGHFTYISELPQSKEARRINGHKMAASGHFTRINKLPQSKEAQREVGRKNVDSGQLARIRQLPQSKEARRRLIESGQLTSVAAKGGRISSCLRWNIRRNKPCVCGKHESEQAA